MLPSSQHDAWPDLPYPAWQETCATLHLWTQIVGKIRLARTPWLNHSWHVPLHVTARGLTTSRIPHGQRSFEIAFDLNEHALGITVRISELPCEIPGAVPFSRGRTHAADDAEHAQRFWRALLQADRVLKQFRTGFIGKCSPVHFFWGSFDLAVTRFSGRGRRRIRVAPPAWRMPSCAKPIPTR